jgi:cysteinyl-tRNA synthetase
MKLYNTLTRTKVLFKPIQPGKVGMYTCGPTVYAEAHIGNFRTFLFEDMLKRYLKLRGLDVFHLMNITDVDDRTIKRAREAKISLRELTDIYSDKFFKDLHTLKISPADNYPRATDHVDIMIDIIDKLIERKHAYQAKDGSVYFNISTYKDYGKLVQLDFSKQQSAKRITSDHYSKDNPQDFVLWKKWREKDGDIWWDSPWGKGRPGWHIECSAMSMKYLGNHFDIHCGGVDNIFPHHENEIAQSVCATGNQFVNIWMHSEHLQIEESKMSKSSGNYFTVSNLIDQGFTPEAIRYILLSAHYRTNVSFSTNKKQEALRIINRVVDFKHKLESLASNLLANQNLPAAYSEFVSAMDDDLDTPMAFASFFEWLRKSNVLLDQGRLSRLEAKEGLKYINNFNAVFDIIPPDKKPPQNILSLVNERETARKAQDWSTADILRKKIQSLGWMVEDTPSGPKCKEIVD